MHAPDPVAARLGTGAQALGDILGYPARGGEQGVDVAGQEVGPQQILGQVAGLAVRGVSPDGILGDGILGQKDQLVGTECDRRAARDVGCAEIEDLPGRRISQRRHQGDRALIEDRPQGLTVDPPHRPGVGVVDPVDHAEGARRDEVARDHRDAHAGHRRVGEPEREQGLDLDPDHPGGLLHAGERRLIRDAQAVDIA